MLSHLVDPSDCSAGSLSRLVLSSVDLVVVLALIPVVVLMLIMNQPVIRKRKIE